MVADENKVIDGQYYKKGDEIWDLGSLECIEVNGRQRSYFGFLNDKDKLPKYDNLGTGSKAILVDEAGNSDTVIAYYHAPSRIWYNLQGGVV